MGLIVTSVEIARPPGEVFAYATDPSRFGEWQAGVVSGHIEGDGVPAVGDRCVMTRRLGGAKRTVTSQITAMDPPAMWAIRGLDGPIRAEVKVSVEPRQEGRQSPRPSASTSPATGSARCCCHWLSGRRAPRYRKAARG